MINNHQSPITNHQSRITKGRRAMLSYGAHDLARAYRTVRENTIKIAEEIPESKYDFAPAPGTRTARQMLTHIALSDSFSSIHKEKRTSFQGVNFPEYVATMPAEEAETRSQASVVAHAYQRSRAVPRAQGRLRAARPGSDGRAARRPRSRSSGLRAGPRVGPARLPVSDLS